MSIVPGGRRHLPAAGDFRSGGMAGSGMNPFQQRTGGFVGAGLAAGEVGFGGDQFAPEGFGQDRLRQPVDPRPGCGQLGFQPVGQSEQLLDPPLLRQGGRGRAKS